MHDLTKLTWLFEILCFVTGSQLSLIAALEYCHTIQTKWMIVIPRCFIQFRPNDGFRFPGEFDIYHCFSLNFQFVADYKILYFIGVGRLGVISLSLDLGIGIGE